MNNNFKDITIKPKEFLITGGTGSLGKTLTKLLIKDQYSIYGVNGIRIFSRDELKQWQMQQEVDAFQKKHGTDICVSYIVGDIRKYDSLYRAFENVDIVINTAAMKQIPTCANNPLEAVMTNIGGVENVIKAALAQKVEKVMHISTDKAVRPINLYGATKTVGEKLLQHANVYSGRKPIAFSCCRYGNVLGSRGSIIPLFKQQIEENKPLTITHEDMTRFWISLPRVGRFLLSCLLEMQGGEIFIPNMYSSKITELVDLIKPYPDYPIEYVGVRDGEKMHECLIGPEEKFSYTDTTSGFKIHKDGENIEPLHSNTMKMLTKKDLEDLLKEEI